MWDLLAHLLRAFTFLAGLLFIYASLFLYESEHNKVQNILEDLWIKIDDRQRSALSRHEAFIHIVATAGGAGLDRIFGKRLVSLRFIGTSACLSLASILLMEPLFRSQVEIEFYPSQKFVRPIMAAGYVILAILSRFIKDQKWIKVWFATTFLSICFLLFILHHYLYSQFYMEHPALDVLTMKNLLRRYSLSILYLGTVISIICDALFLTIIRRVFRWTSNISSLSKMITILCLCCGNILFLILPYYFRNTIAFYILYYRLMESWNNPFYRVYLLVTSSNFYTALISSVFCVFVITMLLHRLLWPIINRPLYALQDLGIVRRKKLLAAIGITLVSIALGYASELLKLFEKVH